MIETISDPDDLRALFPFIDEGVQAIRGKAPRIHEIGADVYAAVQSRAVTLALLRDDDIPWGWTVFYESRGLDQTVEVVSWMTYIRPGAPRGLLQELLEFTDGLAASIGAKRIQFSTTRPAWARRLAPHGYNVASITLEKEVAHGQEQA